MPETPGSIKHREGKAQKTYHTEDLSPPYRHPEDSSEWPPERLSPHPQNHTPPPKAQRQHPPPRQQCDPSSLTQSTPSNLSCPSQPTSSPIIVHSPPYPSYLLSSLPVKRCTYIIRDYDTDNLNRQ
ncbi:uncharacterized protein LOC135203820 [Macrobrachium nipponense]|uniref:uncharacterized protein LOC135203820 n=1 Tax=Macrobrachium nipponense TaxID=159736 RepID=UPI0030C898BC